MKMPSLRHWIAAGCMIASATPAMAEATVDRGAYLARAGDCRSCHTAPGKPPYSGGEAIDTPFGPIFAPNITPDKVHGIAPGRTMNFIARCIRA